MRRFPGRMLDELDSMDVGRFLRAVHAERIEVIEDRRAQHLKNKKIKLSPDEWEAIAEHEDWLNGK